MNSNPKSGELKEKSTAPKPFVFVLIPFDDKHADIYELGIKTACEEAGAYAEKVDEQEFDGTIWDRIYNQIASADLIIAELSDLNPNVFYETGYAHALDRRVILLTRDASRIPFDLKGHPHVVYDGSIKKLHAELKKKVTWAINNPHKHLSSFNLPLEFYIDNIPLTSNPVLLIDRTNKPLTITIHNSLEHEIRPLDFRLQLKAPQYISKVFIDGTRCTTTMMANDLNVSHSFPGLYSILPGEWFSLDLSFHFNLQILPEKELTQFCLRLLTESHPVDYEFQIIPGDSS